MSCFNQGGHQTYEWKVRAADGSEKVVIFNKATFPDASGNIAGLVGVMVDITERKRTEIELKASEDKFYKAFQANPSLMAIRSLKDGHFIDVNDAYINVTGYNREELINADSRRLGITDSETVEKAREIINKQGFIRNWEGRFKTKSGEVHSGLFSATVIQVKGEPCLLSSLQDITDRKRAEEALRESEEKYRAIIENMQEGYHEVDIKGNFTFFNESMRKIIGYEREELLGMNNRQYSDEENARKVYQVYNRVYRTGEPVKNFEWQIIRKDGERRDIDVSISLIRNEEHQPTGFRGIVRDITERKRAEEELQTTLQRLHALVAGMHSSLLLVGEGRIEMANQAFCDYFRLQDSPGDLVGLTPHQLIEKIKNAYLHADEQVRRIWEIARRGTNCYRRGNLHAGWQNMPPRFHPHIRGWKIIRPLVASCGYHRQQTDGRGAEEE